MPIGEKAQGQREEGLFFNSARRKRGRPSEADEIVDYLCDGESSSTNLDQADERKNWRRKEVGEEKKSSQRRKEGSS